MKFGATIVTVAVASTVHPDRLAQIEKVHSTPGVLWKAAAHARFAAEAPGASRASNGVKADWKAKLEASMSSGKVRRHLNSANVAIPDSFDSETNWPQCAKIIGDIRDQSNCGCCWAFGGAEAASDRACIATNATVQIPFSAQDICFCANSDGCEGGYIDAPWEYIQESGVVTGGQNKGIGPFGAGYCSAFSLPHCHHHGPVGKDPYPDETQSGCPSASSPQCPSKCDSDASTEHSDFSEDKWTFDGDVLSASGETGIQQMIMAGGPVETAFTVYEDFENYAGGVYSHVTGSQAGGHAVRMVGWGVDSGTKYWKVANSWNPFWGENGYFRILRGSDEGGIEDSVVGSDPSANWFKKNGPSPPSPPTPPSPTPVPSPSPSPSPTPTPGCTDTNPDEGYCAAVVSLAYCDLIGSDCLKSCGCCDDPSACGGSALKSGSYVLERAHAQAQAVWGIVQV